MVKRICLTVFVLLCQLAFGTLERMSYEFGGQVYEKLTRNLIKENYNVSLFEEPYDGVSYSIGDTVYYFITDAAWHRVIYVRNCESDQEHNYAKYLGIWGTGTREFNAPRGVALDADQHVYVADTDNGRIIKLRLQADTLAWVDEIGTSVLEEPWDLEIEGNKLYVIDAGTHKVYRFSLTGSYEISYGSYGSTVGKFNSPKGVTAQNDLIYISDTDNRRIVALRDKGGYIEFMKWIYPDLYENRYLLDIEVDQRGVIYVCDGARSKILKFSPNLISHCYSFGDYGTGMNQFIYPRGMFIQDTLIAIIEEWTDNSGIQAYKEVVRIKELKTSKTSFDATERNITISFKVDDFSTGAELAVGDREWDFTDLNPDEEYQVVWDGRYANDSLFVPGDYTIHLSLSEGDIEQIQVKIKGTIKSGLISTDEHWTEEGEPYVLTGDVQLAYDGRLTIDPGVKVMPAGNYILSTYTGYQTSNKLIAKGTALNPILFTPHRKLYPEPDSVPKGFWRGIWFHNNYATDSLVLDHCVIEAAGSDSTAVFSRVCPAYISNTKIKRSGGFGLYIMADSSYINNCQFENNDSIPILIRFNSINRITGNVFVNNKPDAIGVYAKTLNTDATIQKQAVPYWFLTHTSFGPNFIIYGQNTLATLIIEPGTNIQCDDEIRLLIGGTSQTNRGKIIAQGTEADSIIITAIDTTKPWLGIHLYSFNPQDTSIFEYCEMSHGWKSNPYLIYGQGILGCYRAHTPFVLKNSVISHSCGLGFNYYTAGADISVIPEIKNNQFIENDSFPIMMPANYLRGMEGNSFINNQNNAIYVKSDNRINKSLIWRNQGVPYIIDGGLTVNGYGDTVVTVEIESGNVLKFKQNCPLNIWTNDRLEAHGTKFTCADSLPWAQIQFNGADTSIIDSCIIEHTWSIYNYFGAIDIRQSTVTITNSQILNNRTGIVIYDESDVEITDNQILLNKNGVWVRSFPQTILVQNNDFSGNKCAFISPYGGGYPYTQADSNWWGDPSGPWDPVEGDPLYNPGGKGDSIGAHVYYEPWLTEPVHGQGVTLNQPNGNEILYCGTYYSIQWIRYVTPTVQELYYTTDFPEGGAKEEALWQFIDTVAIGTTSYQWQVPSTPSARCRVAVKIYYEAETEGKEVSKLGSWDDEIASPLDKLGTRNDKEKETDRRNGMTCENDATRGLVALQSTVTNLGKALLQSSKNEYESRSTNTISIDISDGNFSILDTVFPQITLIQPNGGEYFIPAKEETIRWQASDNHKLASFDIVLSTDGGGVYEDTILTNLQAPCSTYIWIPSEQRCYTCRVKVLAYDSSANDREDMSDANFYIPVKSNSDEMSAYNNAQRLIRSFSSGLHLVYTTSESGGFKQDKSKSLDMTRHLRADYRYTKDRQLRDTDKVYYIKSSNLGSTWLSSTEAEIGNGLYPTMAMDDYASKIGIAWSNENETEVYYRYRSPFGGWARTTTIFSEVSDVTYSPVAIAFVNDTIYLATLRTEQISRTEAVQDVLYAKFRWDNPGSGAGPDTIDHWRLQFSDPWPRFVSIAVDPGNKTHIAWERPPGDTIFTQPTPFDIFYIQNGGLIADKINVSNSDSNSVHPSIDCYGGHYYIVWQEKINGYSIFLFKRNYAGFPPSSKTDTIGQVAGSPQYPVSSMGGVVLWADGDPADIYGRVWDSKHERWFDAENWSNTPEVSMYPQVTAWQSEGGTEIIGAWTEDTDTSGFGRHYVSLFPGKDRADISFPSYYLDLGDTMSTPFTQYRDTIALYGNHRFDHGQDSLVYYLPHINQLASCRFYAELYRPDSGRTSAKGGKWKVKLNIDNIVHRVIKLTPGQMKVVELDIPWLVNANGSALIKFRTLEGDCVLARRVILYEYEKFGKSSGMSLAGGGLQTTEYLPFEPIFFDGIYPNPTKGDFIVRFNSPDQRYVRISLYDVTGRLVDEILNSKTQTPGIHEIPIRSQELAAGIYFVRMETEEEIITEKVIMLK